MSSWYLTFYIPTFFSQLVTKHDEIQEVQAGPKMAKNHEVSQMEEEQEVQKDHAKEVAKIYEEEVEEDQ